MAALSLPCVGGSGSVEELLQSALDMLRSNRARAASGGGESGGALLARALDAGERAFGSSVSGERTSSIVGGGGGNAAVGTARRESEGGQRAAPVLIDLVSSDEEGPPRQRRRLGEPPSVIGA